MEKHRCKLCSRTFANGRALGGHMKGHLAALPLPPKPRTIAAESASSWSSSSSSSEDEDDEDKFLIYTLRENPKKSVKLADPEFSAVVVQDRESESESRNPTRKRSKRTRKSAFLQQQQPMMKKQSLMIMGESQSSPPVSTISDASPEEDIAMCLIMLSRDKWTTKQENYNAEKEFVVNKFECDKCKKKFRSSKALAGHRAVHSKNKRDNEGGGDDKDKIFECPFCFKVFGSGQALGGHKRSHLLGHHANNSNGNVSFAHAAAAASSSSTAMNNSTVDEVKMDNTVMIDLNLPAPVEEDDDYSVVSQAEIVN